MKKRIVLLSVLLSSALLLSGCGKGSNSPKVTLSDYSSITVDRIVSEISDEDVQDEIDMELYSNAEYNEVTNRPAKNGDTVTVDYIGYLDGEIFDGGSETDAEIVLGDQEYIDGFEEGIVGMELDETKEIKITFPEDYTEDLSGKEASFEVTLKQITEVTAPELTDEYVAEHTDYTSVDEYKAALKDELQLSADLEASSMANYDALAQIVENSEISDYPEDMLQEAVENIKASNESFAEQFGMDISELYGDDYDPEDDAKEMLKERMVVQAIADKEKLEVSDDEYDAYVDSIWDQYGYDSREDFESEYSKEDIVYELLYEKVLEAIGAYVTYNDVTEEEYYGSYDMEDDIVFEEDIEDDGEIITDLDDELLDALYLDDLEEEDE